MTGTIHPYRGEWIEFDVEAKPGKDITAGSRVARKRRLSLFVLLRALGYTDEGFLERFVRHFDFLEGQWEKERELAPTQEEALLEIYKRARPGEPPSTESARVYFENAFFNPKRYDLTRVGRYKLDRKLGPEIAKAEDLFGIDLERPTEGQGVLSRAEILAACSYLLHLAKGESGYRLDDQDHFANRRIRSVGELIQNQVRVGLSRMERVVRERMTTQDVEAITPQTLINIRPVVAAIKEFFGTSQLSQFMDQTNPLSGLTHKRRLSAMGPGGLSRERAGFEVRDVHTSHYGRMCPIETPEGPNIGLIGHLASYGRINSYGFIETPYRKVVDGRVTDEITYLAADEEEEYVIAQANAKLAEDGTLVEDRVLVRRAPQGPGVRVGAAGTSYGTTSEVDFVPPAEVDLMDVSPKQIVSISTALIPFIEHDDANRALMGANMQKQAVPLVRPEAPFIGTGVEARAARDAGDVLLAEGDRPRRRGLRRSRHRRVPARPVRLGRHPARPQGLPAGQVPPLQPEHLPQPAHPGRRGRPRSPRATSWPTAPRPRPASSGLGKNLLVAFMPWEGYNYEDAIILSERLVRDDVLDLDPHRGARGRRPGHQARRRGDHPGHPQPVRGDPQGPRRARHHPHRRRGRPRRRAGRQGHPQGRDRADPRGAPPAGHLR